MNKVYCFNCEYCKYDNLDKEHYCENLNTIEEYDTPLKHVAFFSKCKTVNNKNDCKFFKEIKQNNFLAKLFKDIFNI